MDFAILLCGRQIKDIQIYPMFTNKTQEKKMHQDKG